MSNLYQLISDLTKLHDSSMTWSEYYEYDMDQIAVAATTLDKQQQTIEKLTHQIMDPPAADTDIGVLTLRLETLFWAGNRIKELENALCQIAAGDVPPSGIRTFAQHHTTKNSTRP